MKIFCMHVKIILCVTAALILLGIITVTPCAIGQRGSILGRSYGLDCGRAKELCSIFKGHICSSN
jgi:hypothetical protein